MDLTKWAAARAVVAGRLVNCYAWNDWILALLYRSKSYEIGVAGLYPIVLTGAGAGGRVKSSNGGVKGGNAGDGNIGVKGDVKSGVECCIATEVGAVGDGSVVPVDTSSVEVTTTHVTDSTTTSARKSRVLHKHGSAFEVENFDVSHLITSHTDYPRVLPAIIAMLDL